MMDDTPITRARANSQGHPCPPWCVTDHDERVGRSRFTLTYHGTEALIIHTDSGYVAASAYQDGSAADPPGVALTCLAPGGAVLLDVHDSGKMAGFIEQLADATPDQHRELAAAIRKAAADITEAGNG